MLRQCIIAKEKVSIASSANRWKLGQLDQLHIFFSIRDVAKSPVLLSLKFCHFFSTAVPYSSLIFPLFLDTYVSYRSPIFLVSYTFDNSEALLSTNQTYLMGALKSSTRTTLLTKISIFQNYFIVFCLSLVSPKYFEFGSAVSYFFEKIQYCLLLSRLF